jgi:hypothetical protein
MARNGNKNSENQGMAPRLTTKCHKYKTHNHNHFSRNIHLNCRPWDPGRLQKSYPALRIAVKTC